MSVDPTDDCTFWYTNEYVATSNGTWGTRIGAFSFPTCQGNDFTVPELNFEGISFTGAFPPDTVGDVGPNHYIQMVNDGAGGSVFAIYDKLGNSVVDPTSLQSLWTAGGPCASGLDDPIVLYDSLADRWLMSEFDSTRFNLCVYISQTGDPVSGGWFLYEFLGPELLDYPKYGVWPDAYYVSSNESSPTAYALDRSRMLNGQPATFQRFQAPRLSGFDFQALTPSDIDGSTLPPAGSPHYFIRHRDDEANPGLITLTDPSSTWQSISIDVSSAMGSPQVVIRFAFDTIDPVFNEFEGFYVDDVVLSVDSSAVFSEDFEGGASGWVGTGLWHLTTTCSAPLQGHTTPTTFYYGQDTACNYETGLDNSGTLTSPVLDLSAGGSAANLSLNYFLATEQFCHFDDARVQISTDGGATFQDLLGNCVGPQVESDPNQDLLEIWQLQVDFADPANSAFTGPFTIAVSEFDSGLCGLTSFSCFPQPDTFMELDPLREVVMWRSQYRNFGSHETLVGNFVTDVDGTDHGGIRWYELRRTGGDAWALFQEGTYAPDESHRWMGSVAMDKDGNIALGYSVSGAEILSDPNEPNNNFTQATPITCPAFVSADALVDPLGDVDYYLLNGTPDLLVRIDLDADELGSPLNSLLGVFDSGQNLLATSDNNPAPGETFTLDSFLQVAMPTDGQLFIAVSSDNDTEFDGGANALTSGRYILAVSCVQPPSPPQAGDLLGSTGNFGNALIDIDPATGAATLRAPSGSFGPVTELEYRGDGSLIGATGAGSSVLLAIDPVSGAESFKCYHTFRALTALEFVDGTLYGALNTGPDTELVIVGEPDAFGECPLTVIGPTGFLGLGGLAYDLSTDTLFGCVSGAFDPSAGHLVVCDRVTGACTSIGPTGFDRCSAMEFAPDGTLYGGIGSASPDDAGKLITIATDTGTGTEIGPTGFPGISGLAFVPIPGDLDDDWDVGAADRAIIRGALRTCVGDPGFIAEANYDGGSCITFGDYREWYKLAKAFADY